MIFLVISPSGYMLHYLRNNDWKLPKRSYVIQNLYPPESLPTTSDDQTPIKVLRNTLEMHHSHISSGTCLLW